MFQFWGSGQNNSSTGLSCTLSCTYIRCESQFMIKSLPKCVNICFIIFCGRHNVQPYGKYLVAMLCALSDIFLALVMESFCQLIILFGTFSKFTSFF